MEDDYFLYHKIRKDLEDLVAKNKVHGLKDLFEKDGEFFLVFKENTEIFSATIDQGGDCYLHLPELFEERLKRIEKPVESLKKHYKIHLGHFENNEWYKPYGTVFLHPQHLYKNLLLKINNSFLGSWFKKEIA